MWQATSETASYGEGRVIDQGPGGHAVRPTAVSFLGRALPCQSLVGGSRAFLGDPGHPDGLARASLDGATSGKLPSHFPLLRLGSRELPCFDSSCTPMLLCHRHFSHQCPCKFHPCGVCFWTNHTTSTSPDILPVLWGFQGGPTYI